MRLKENMAIHAFWNSLRRGPCPPLRAEFDPMALAPWLPDIFMLSVRPGMQAVFRLAGTGLYDRFGRELRGQPFSVIWQGAAQRLAALILYDMALDGRPRVLSLSGTTDAGNFCGPFEMLLLPFRTEVSGELRVMGTLRDDGSHETGIPVALHRLGIGEYDVLQSGVTARRTAPPVFAGE